MVAFATLFLGLVLGVNDVKLVTGAEVARVVVRLDGAEVAAATAPHWIARVDLGSELSPHELVAVAYGADGRELGTARQWVNRPRSPAEVSVVVERRGEKRLARLSWASITGARPKVVSVAVDGEPVAFSDPNEVTLPDVDPDRLHVFHADLDFEGGVSATVDLAFGGGRTDEASARLTALPVVLPPKTKLPAPERLHGWFELDGRPLPVVAVEEGPADVVLVPQEGAREALGEIVRDLARPITAGALGLRFQRDILQSFARLKKEQRAKIVWTVPEHRQHAGFRYDLFPRSEDMTPKDGGLLYLLTNLRRHGLNDVTPRVADAVAVGALSAAGRDRRRAVVLLLGPEPGIPDASSLAPGIARRYLERLGVPLDVWCVGRASDPVWGACKDVATAGRFDRAAKDLASSLERQRIVWVEGTLLPHTVSLGREARVGFAR